ncbi:MAG: YdcF family protein [Pseudomonadota bacterium]
MSASLIAISVIRSLILPPVSLVLVYAAGRLLRKRWPLFGKSLSAGAIVVLYLLSTGMGVSRLVNPLEALNPPLASSQGTGAQAIVVLAAGRLMKAPEYGNQDIPDYIALGRLRYAAKLYRETRLPVLVSGGLGSPASGKPPLAAGMASALENEFSTPVKWREDASANTSENAAYSARILKQAGITRVFLVTDAMHMHRSRMAFIRQGLEVVAAPTIFFRKERLIPGVLIPSLENLRLSHYAVYEWMGLVWYRWRYGIPAGINY